MSTLTPVFMMPGGIELAIILLLVVLLFGANRLPELARATGRSLGEFHKGREAVERELIEATTPPTPEIGAVPEAEPAD